MTKSKKGKKALADQVYAKKAAASAKANPFATATTATSKKLNPFEVHVNKEKFQILGRTCKHDKGLPGFSRTKAEKKRQETLGVEYGQKHKSNKFHDRRIGKYQESSELSEDVLNARFVAEKLAQLKQSAKIARFNLNDDEILTHRGQTLEEIEQFRDDRSDDEDIIDERLDAEFTAAAHFGGDAAQMKDRQAAIDEMILEQKRRKIEIAKEKDEVFDLTEKLDANYKELLGLVNKMTKKEMQAKPPPDDYDKVMREMIFEPRGVVTDKLLSEEELAKQEKDRLEKLEEERLRRMQGEGEESTNTAAQSTHRSADALDDGYFGYDDVEEDTTLAYTLEGELGTTIETNGNVNIKKTEATDSENEDGNAVDEEDDDENVGEEEDDEEDEEGEEKEEEGNEDDSSDDDEDNLSDLKVSQSDVELDDETEQDNAGVKEPAKTQKSKPNQNATTDTVDSADHYDLPYTLDMPTAYEEFHALLLKRTPVEQGIIIERLIKCNHPKLDGINNKGKMVQLFTYLLQYINECFTDATQDDISLQFQILDKLNPHLYDLMHMNPEKMSATLLAVIKEKYASYRKNIKFFPPLETLIFFKLVSNYCSSSDFRHAVVTPCYIFIQHILSKARVRSRQDIASGLFLATIALEFSRQSKRFLPAALNFLLGVVFLSVPKRAVEVLKIVPPFQSNGPMNKLLAIAELENKESYTEELLRAEDLVMTTFSVDFKIRALNMTLKLIKDVITNVEENIGVNYLATPYLEMLERLPLDTYPDFVRTNYETAEKVLKVAIQQKLTKIVPPAKKPKALRLLEPRIEPIFDDKRRPRLTKDKEEKVKLVHKLRRETKGAMREIRRDTGFLQKIRIQQQIQSDNERREKVKRIYQEAAMQQGELNELDRLKKRKKF